MSVTFLFTFIEYIDLTQEPDNPVVEYWMKDFQLYPSDKDCITDGKWLINSIIIAVGYLTICVSFFVLLWEGNLIRFFCFNTRK